ncbi:MAG: DUF1641 domain-containing protein [Alicyclobacillaceae bacterium]|jgi:uncharacterized protein YjgD (DUF1641 family)|uniref:DUF1641 domain-containing protein n=1 Tax=Alicyclobacillus sp. SP_1 TaxID=2942475 RepID=UPI002156F8F1|nr:DUF1641 domain-containing protein [Alicyclobacillus sp. SP_1]MCY0887041.1 DUF1641 domain-containing protein [Alicyclobacillaceae bacterium]
MAQATTTIATNEPSLQEQQAEMMEQLFDVLMQNSEGISTGAVLLQELHEKGLLDLLVGLVRQGNDIVRIVVELLTKEEYMNSVKKVVGTVQGLSEVNSESLAAAMKSVIRLLQELSDKGLLDFVVGLLEHGNDIVKATLDIAAKAAQSKSIQTLLAVMEDVGSLDAEALGKTFKGVSAGLAKMTETAPTNRPMGFFELLRMMKDPDVSAALQSGFAFLKGMGQALRQTGERN